MCRRERRAWHEAGALCGDATIITRTRRCGENVSHDFMLKGKQNRMVLQGTCFLYQIFLFSFA